MYLRLPLVKDLTPFILPSNTEAIHFSPEFFFFKSLCPLKRCQLLTLIRDYCNDSATQLQYPRIKMKLGIKTRIEPYTVCAPEILPRLPLLSSQHSSITVTRI